MKPTAAAPLATELVMVPTDESITPLTEILDGVIAPSVSVIAGVVVAVATLPDTPLAVVTETEVTVPDPVAVNAPADSDKPDPTVISSIAPVAAVVRPRRRLVAIVRPEAVAAPFGASVKSAACSAVISFFAVNRLARRSDVSAGELSAGLVASIADAITAPLA